MQSSEQSLAVDSSRLRSDSTPDIATRKQIQFVRKPTFDRSYFGLCNSMVQTSPKNFSSDEYLAKLPWDLIVNNQNFNDFYLTSKVKNINDFQTKIYMERIAQKLRLRQLFADTQKNKPGQSAESNQAQKMVSLGMIGFVKNRIATLQSEKLERERVALFESRLQKKRRQTAWKSSSRSSRNKKVPFSHPDQVRENEEKIARKKNERVKRINQLRQQKEMEKRIEKEMEKNNRGTLGSPSGSKSGQLSGTKDPKYH